ncbi:MAG: hypothetical protein AMS19_14675 [Gemmatimonas sp. SG8_23]|nr:MAG: hypothetical protein AMS19_14675 [Gemmatimonas sp. SG8_23]
MNAQATPVWSVAFLACSGLFAAASAQEPAPGEPGPEHEVLAGLVGSWEVGLEGTDDDQYMRSLGFTKEFVIELHVPADDRVAIETRFIDTRTDARTEMPFLRFDLVRRP